MHPWEQERGTEVSTYPFPNLVKVRGNAAIYCHTTLKSEVTIEKHDPDPCKEEPMPTVDNPVNFEMSPRTSPFAFGETLISDCQLDDGHQELEEADPLAFSPVKVSPDVSDHTTDQLLALAAEGLRMRLKPNWICLIEGDGIHTMQLSRNFEKCVQRRIFFTRSGDVHLSVHCVPVPISNFVSCLRMVQLQNQRNISEFVDAIETTVHVIRQLEICTGVCHEKYRPLWESSKRGEVDKNPYQEARYSVTFRSFQCCRLVRPRQRMCFSCDRLHDSLRMMARSAAKKSDKSHPHPKSVARKSVTSKIAKSAV